MNEIKKLPPVLQIAILVVAVILGLAILGMLLRGVGSFVGWLSLVLWKLLGILLIVALIGGAIYAVLRVFTKK